MARIKIDLDRQLGSVDRRIFGGFIENMRGCIYGGIFDEGSPLSDEQGYRLDVLKAIRDLQPTVLRGPGGNFVSGYHWLDGVGPVEQRPRRLELAWRAEESNHFGTAEFLRYCELIGAEPHVCVNMGNGTMDEAQAWVEYCNGTGNTSWANLRRQHGHPEPYNVTYWGLGNEMYGDWQIGSLNAEDYVKKAREFAKVMKWTDPDIKLVSCGKFGVDEWDRVVIEGLAPWIDYHSIHLYTGSHDYYSNVFAAHQAERALKYCRALIEHARYHQQITHPIDIAYDEWNIWHIDKNEPDLSSERYNLADALGIATYFNIFIRQCHTVKMANFALLVNVSAPIVTNKTGLVLQSSYFPLQLYAQHTLERALDIYVDSDTFDLLPEQEITTSQHHVADMGPFQLLDISVTCNSERDMMVIAVVNRDLERPHTTQFQLTDAHALPGTEVFELNGAHPDSMNSFEQPDAVNVQKRCVAIEGKNFSYVFPPHSLTLLRVPVQNRT